VKVSREAKKIIFDSAIKDSSGLSLIAGSNPLPLGNGTKEASVARMFSNGSCALKRPTQTELHIYIFAANFPNVLAGAEHIVSISMDNFLPKNGYNNLFLPNSARNNVINI